MREVGTDSTFHSILHFSALELIVLSEVGMYHGLGGPKVFLGGTY